MDDLQKKSIGAAGGSAPRVEVFAQSSPLGKVSPYHESYAPELLFPIARREKRAELGIKEGLAAPFYGEDLWNAYELSWLNPRGKPMVALAEFRVPADSPCLIESKSIKLYLNSFNQSVLASVGELQSVLQTDLSAAAGASVAVRVLPVATAGGLRRYSGWTQAVLLDDMDIDVNVYQLQPEFLRTDGGTSVDETLLSHLLKSNCLVTGQPDWGSLLVRYRGAPIDHAGLLRYLVSFRQHNEFHEQCVERVFMDITRRCQPERLEVWARYTRRGGLDINPYRSSVPLPPPENLFEIRQ